MEGYRLHIIQGTQSDSLLMLNSQMTMLNNNRETERQKLIQLSKENTQLNMQLDEYTRLEQTATDLRPEMATLFPQISHFSLSRVSEVNRDSANIHTYVAAIIQSDKPLTVADSKKLHDWLQARIKADTLVMVGSILSVSGMP